MKKLGSPWKFDYLKRKKVMYTDTEIPDAHETWLIAWTVKKLPQLPNKYQRPVSKALQNNIVICVWLVRNIQMTTRADAARRVSLMPQNKWRNGSQRQRKALCLEMERWDRSREWYSSSFCAIRRKVTWKIIFLF